VLKYGVKTYNDVIMGHGSCGS